MKSAALTMTWIHLTIRQPPCEAPTPAMADYALDCLSARTTGMWL